MYRVMVALESGDRAEELVQAIVSHELAAFLDVFTVASLDEFKGSLTGARYPDIVFIDPAFDARAEGPSGIDLIERYFSGSAGVQVVYVSQGFDYVMQVYRTRHINHLVGPVMEEGVHWAIDQAAKRLRVIADRPLTVRADGHLRALFPRRIRFVESDRRKCHIHVDDEMLTTYATLDSLARELPPSFVRSHKSFLVNMGFVESVGVAYVNLFGGEQVPVSQKRRHATNEAFMRYSEGCRRML